MIEIDSSATLASSPVLWTALAIATVILFQTFFSAPTGLHRKDSPLGSYKTFFGGLGPVSYYSTRNGLLRSIFGNPESWHQTPPTAPAYRLNARDNVVISTNNTKDAHVFFTDRSLNFNKGYEIMFAGLPKVPKWVQNLKKKKPEEEFDFALCLRQALNRARLNAAIPDLIEYSVEAFTQLPKQNGTINVHDVIYPLIFRLTIRLLGLMEHARDAEIYKRLETPFWQFSDNTGYMATHFPLVPVPSTLSKWSGAVKMSVEVRKMLAQRKAQGRREDDYIQVLIDQGRPDSTIDQFVIGSIFAGIINTTGVASFFLLFLCSDAKLYARVRNEMVTELKRHAEERGDDWDTLTVKEKIERVPIEVLENNLPQYDNLVKETLRLLLVSSLFRCKAEPTSKATQRDTFISGHKVQPGEIVSFWLSAAHLNSTIYTNPEKIDPDRFERGEGSKEGEFVPWGTGNHPCLGMRFAKLEMVTAHAAFLLSFPDVQSVDLNGKPYDLDTVPRPDPESEHRRYPQKPVVISYKSNLASS